MKSLLLGKGKFANQEYSVAAYLQLAPQVTGKFSLPNRYGNDSKKKLTQIKIDEIHDLMRGGRKFYVVKHGSHAGSADIDLISPDEAVLPYAMCDGKFPLFGRFLLHKLQDVLFISIFFVTGKGDEFEEDEEYSKGTYYTYAKVGQCLLYDKRYRQ